ncbi:MAG: hypothetical protein K2J79_03210 [Ruminiclostridium sp.]|nr:hypothetical protein [Ruminiclostridium sp.]
MKGLLYYSLLLNKKWFWGAGIIAAVSTAVCFFLYKNDDAHNVIIELSFTLLQTIVVFICTEWLGRSLEADIKCRFADYVLTSGTSKRTFILVELAKNIISLAISYAMCIIMQFIMRFRDFTFLRPIILLNFLLIVGILRWITSLVTIPLRSAEKSGLIVVIAFVLVIIVLLALPPVKVNDGGIIYQEMPFIAYLVWSEMLWLHQIVYLAVIAAIYAIVYALFLHRIRKGDVCR